MCGISGFVGRTETCVLDREGMLKHIARRGPDGSGHQVGGFYILAHTRLAIIDLSVAAAQPFQSACGRYVLIFNGEIFNYKQLKSLLVDKYGIDYRSAGDTEVLLELLINEGIYKTLELVEGFFSFCFVDSFREQVFLARDHLGVKPLYYTSTQDGFYFSSSMYTLSTVVSAAFSYDREAIASYLVDGFFCSPRTPICSVKKLEPGTFLELDSAGEIVRRQRYFDLQVEASKEQPDSVKAILESASLRRVSDVDIALLLSSGVDSTLLAHIYGGAPSISVKAYTVDFDGSDERVARSTAYKAGIKHSILDFDKKYQELGGVDFSNVYDEPFADISSLPTFLIYKSLSHDRKVAIGGDGGDEIYLGYKRYSFLRKYSKYSKFIDMCPKFLLRGGFFVAIKIFRNKAFHLKRLRHLFIADKSNKLSALNCVFLPDEVSGYLSRYRGSSLKDCVVSDLQYYLPDDIFFKVDRASMHWGVEAREPLASKGLVRGLFARIEQFNLDGVSKKCLKKMLLSYDPEYSSTAKRGFSFDISLWAESNYSADSVRRYKLFLEQRGLGEVISSNAWRSLNVSCSDSYLKLYSLASLVGWMAFWEQLTND